MFEGSPGYSQEVDMYDIILVREFIYAALPPVYIHIYNFCQGRHNTLGSVTINVRLYN